MFAQTSLTSFLSSDVQRHVVVSSERALDVTTPVLAALLFLNCGHAGYVLESAEGGEKMGRYSFVGWNEQERVQGRADGTADELGRIRQFVASHAVCVLTPGLPSFPACAVGFLGYDTIRLVEPSLLAGRRHDPGAVPDFVLVHFRHHVIFDHLRRRLHVALVLPPAQRTEQSFARAMQEIDNTHDVLTRQLTRAGLGRAQGAGSHWNDGPDEAMQVDVVPDAQTYRAQVAQAQELIQRGDIFQVVLARRFSAPFKGDPFAVYRSLRMLNPSPFQVFFDTGAFQLVGSSPEDLVRVRGGRVETLPIAGTRRRGASAVEDASLASDLLNDPKERAEHMMLVDLARNDIGRVSASGTVRVESLMEVEHYSHVMHLVSRVSGELRPEVDALDALLACFPAGTVSGAPKVRAMEIIDEMEPVGRGPYAGAVCYFDGQGGLDSCITIRTLLFQEGMASVHAGAGVVADSVPESEEQETRQKSSAILEALRQSPRFM